MNGFSDTLLDWYARNKRDLPWRDTKDPYRIWISEIILQQTRVVQGYDYFLRFMKRFPDVQTRARNLYAAACSMNGVFPRTYEAVRALKGVGEYTAAAICSFAYNLPHAVVDGNVYRVFSRYFGIETPIDSTQGKKLFAALADEMLDRSCPADYNHAIMDFGALQCTPQSPCCIRCPLADSCSAFRENRVMLLPTKQHKTKTTERYFNYIYVRAGAETFIHKRTGNDIWKNLYELPLIETDRAVSEEEFLASSQFEALFADGETPLSVRLVREKVKHVLSHRVIYANFYEVTLPVDTLSFQGYLRIGQDELEEYAVSRLVHIFLEKYL